MNIPTHIHNPRIPMPAHMLFPSHTRSFFRAFLLAHTCSFLDTHTAFLALFRIGSPSYDTSRHVPIRGSSTRIGAPQSSSVEENNVHQTRTTCPCSFFGRLWLGMICVRVSCVMCLAFCVRVRAFMCMGYIGARLHSHLCICDV